MGCNCKNKIEAINKNLGDGGNENKFFNPLLKIIAFVSRIAFGILCGAIIIVMIVPMLIYVILCIMFGRDANFKIKDITKYLNKD